MREDEDISSSILDDMKSEDESSSVSTEVKS